MLIKRIVKLIKIFLKFKNPLAVFNFFRGKFVKGELIKVKPRNGDSFFVARSGDFWLINRILNNQRVITSLEQNQNYIIQDNIYLRQGTSDTFIYKEIFINKCYEQCINELVQNDTVIDIGAHIGLFSLRCAPTCGQIFAYELHPENFKLALKNIKNKNIRNIKIYNLAVSSSAGNLVGVFDHKGGRTGESMIKVEDGNPEDENKIKTTTLESVFTQNNISNCDLLKIDIEGGEYAVLFSTPDEIFAKIKIICLEYHPDPRGKYAVDDLIRFLKDKGFNINKKEITKSIGLIYAKRN